MIQKYLKLYSLRVIFHYCILIKKRCLFFSEITKISAAILVIAELLECVVEVFLPEVRKHYVKMLILNST